MPVKETSIPCIFVLRFKDILEKKIRSTDGRKEATSKKEATAELCPTRTKTTATNSNNEEREQRQWHPSQRRRFHAMPADDLGGYRARFQYRVEQGPGRGRTDAPPQGLAAVISVVCAALLL